MSRYKKKIYILGAKGNIGTNLCNFLLNHEYAIERVCRDPEEGYMGFDQFLKIISSIESSYIVNAAYLDLGDLRNLLKVVLGKHKIVHISSASVYGNTNLRNSPNPINDYGKRKLEEESLFIRCSNAAILRLSNIYGGCPETSGLEILFNKGRLRYIEVDDNGDELIRDYVHCSELMHAVLEVIKNFKPQIRNISSGRGLTITQHLALVGKDVSKLPRIKVSCDSVIRCSVIDPKFQINI